VALLVATFPLASKNYLLEKQKFQQSTNVRVATNALHNFFSMDNVSLVDATLG